MKRQDNVQELNGRPIRPDLPVPEKMLQSKNKTKQKQITRISHET